MSEDTTKKHSDNTPNTGLWFITEPGHVETLAEVCRLGQADTIDISRIYWLGKTCRSLIIAGERLKEKLYAEREFNVELRDASKRFNEILINNHNNFNNEEVVIEVQNLVNTILKHTNGKHYKNDKPTLLEFIVSKFRW